MSFYLPVLIGLWAAIALFYWQYRECRALQRREKSLEQRNAEMTCFVYGAAHDLKAPLRAIMQAGDRLAETAVAAQEEDVALLCQRARRMGTLIDDLLDYWQAGQPTSYAHNYNIDMDTLTRDVIGFLETSEDFSFDIDPALKTMMVRHMPMRQVLMNLIGNALKHHGGTQGRITVSGADAGACYRFCVADDGAGIPEEYRIKIFEPFETLKSKDEVEGSGLGLSLVKRILDRQRTSIYVADAPEGGAAFHFTWAKNQRD